MADPLEGAVRVEDDPLRDAVPVSTAETTQPPDTFLSAIGRSVRNVAAAPIHAGKQLIGELSRIPSNIAQAKDIELRSLLNPGIVGSAAVQTAKDVAAPLINAAPEMIGGGIGGVVGGPPGAIGGASIARGLTSMAQGRTATGVTEDLLTTAGVSATSAGIPPAARFMAKAPGRYLSMPAERHAAGAEMMTRIPEKFGVDDASVNAGYANASSLAAQPPVARAPLPTLTQAVTRMNAQASRNPLTAIRDKALVSTLTNLEKQLRTTPSVNAAQLDAIVKAINQKIGSTTGPERGAWKQMLGAVHDDLSSAAASTGDPAFSAYAKAISEAHKNFLRADIEEAIRLSGIKTQRTGDTVITSPGKIQDWMRGNPDWASAVERASPGLLQSIKDDIAKIVPVTDIVGRSIPGQRFGSGRLALGGSVGFLLSRALGISPETAASVGAILGGVSPQMGVKMSPGFVERSFRPVNRTGSVPGAIGGAVTAESQRQGDTELRDLLQRGR